MVSHPFHLPFLMYPTYSFLSDVEGHTVLRFAADVYTDNLLSMARSINPSAPTFFKATLSPFSKSSKEYKAAQSQAKSHEGSFKVQAQLITTPHKLEWSLTPDLLIGIRFAETRLSDMICQNDSQALEFTGFGKRWITKRGFSPDAFVQMAFQAGYYGLYGRVECTYEPAMTKAFLHGRTEAIRTVQPESVKFTKVRCCDGNLWPCSSYVCLFSTFRHSSLMHRLMRKSRRCEWRAKIT